MDFGTPILEQRYPAKAEALRDMRQTMKKALEDIGLPAQEQDPLVLAVDEACANIIEHAYGKERSGDFLLEIFFARKEIVFRITDYANPIDPSSIVSRDLDDIRPHGLGVRFMRELMDEVIYNQDSNIEGNILIMKKEIK